MKKKAVATRIDTSSRPYISNYPELDSWLRRHNASCMWQTPRDQRPEDADGDWHPQAFVECWMVNHSLVLVVVHANKGGWELYTCAPNRRVLATLEDANQRLGISK